MKERVITCAKDLAEGARWLAVHDKRFQPALKACGDLPLRLRAPGFETLLSAIVSQQISVAAAQAVWTRLEGAGLTRSDTILTATPDLLRTCGLSRQKIVYVKALADSGIDYAGLETLTSDDVIKTLVAVKGIGRWSAEIYAMFSLGRADVFAAGDLALQESARELFALPARPSERQLRKMARAWSPWQSVAARLLWSYYRVIKNREGIV